MNESSTTTTMAATAAVMTGGMTITTKVHFGRSAKGARRAREGAAPPPPPPSAGTVPRVARLMALALRLEGLVRRGEVGDYAELARVGMVSRARLSQLTSLTLLAPEIIEEILFLPPTVRGRDPIGEQDLRPIAVEADWGVQRQLWRELGSRR